MPTSPEPYMAIQTPAVCVRFAGLEFSILALLMVSEGP